MSTTSKRCQAKNPNTCRWHGTPLVHHKMLQTASKNYTAALRKSLSQPDSLIIRNELQKAKDEYNERRAVFEAHDEQYNKLWKQLKELEGEFEIEGTTYLEHFSQSFRDNYEDLQDRLDAANEVREKLGREVRMTPQARAKDPVRAELEDAKRAYDKIVEDRQAYFAANPVAENPWELLAKGQPPELTPEAERWNEKRDKAFKRLQRARQILSLQEGAKIPGNITTDVVAPPAPKGDGFDILPYPSEAYDKIWNRHRNK